MPRILIIKPSSLGDIIHGLLVAESIRRQMPDTVIDWVARDVFAPLVEACATVNRVHYFFRDGGQAAFGPLLQSLQRESYDWVLDFQGLARSGIMAGCSGTPRERRIGRRDAREGSRWACGKIVDLPPAGRDAHAVDILREFLPALGLKNELRGHLTFPGAEGAPSELVAGSILLFPGSRRAEKEWPGFEALTARLLEEPGTPPLAWAGNVPVEAPAGWPTDRFVNLTGKTSLAALPSLIGMASLVVSNDSGPMHLAAAMNRPVLGIFGPTPPERFGPYPLDAPDHGVIRAPDGRLDDLGVETVAGELLAYLRQGEFAVNCSP